VGADGGSTLSVRVCQIASHSRLEALVKQLELLRHLDAEAHEAVKGELQEQIVRLKGQVGSLSASLEATSGALSSAKHALSAAPPGAAPHQFESADLSAAIAACDNLKRENLRLKQLLVESVRVLQARGCGNGFSCLLP
jgi:chromosome segregation ATPase